jgi:hypothetical protein
MAVELTTVLTVLLPNVALVNVGVNEVENAID